MEDMVLDRAEFWKGRRVFLTGHTGFKGSWLSLWLSSLGAKVYGFALEPITEPSMFKTAAVESRLAGHVIGDIRDRQALAAAIRQADPEIIFHLAAQPLVRLSYADPVSTIETNVIGSMNILECARDAANLKAIVNVTTDKVYENREWLWPYREDEALGGYDPYSASKACSEILTSAYRRSFLASAGKALASARAGNVIGGGDWSSDRLIPDFIRAVKAGQQLPIRYPDAVRPWQHVLEVLSGYMLLAQKLYVEGSKFADSWNLGPDPRDAKSVRWIVDSLCEQFEGSSWRLESAPKPHEAGELRLDASRAQKILGWRPVWDIDEAIRQTAEWYQAWLSGSDMAEVTMQQIGRYSAQLGGEAETNILEISGVSLAEQTPNSDARAFFGKILRVKDLKGRLSTRGLKHQSASKGSSQSDFKTGK